MLLVACTEEADIGANRDRPGAPNSQSLYVVATSFEAGDQRETYLVTTGRFDRATELDPTDGPKVLGGVVPIAHAGSVYVPDAGRPVIMRFAPRSNGRLEKKDELSFMGEGLNEVFSWHTFIVDDTKAYVFDQSGARLIVWNPKTMALSDKVIDLSELEREGWLPNLVFEHSGPIARGDELIIPLGWVDQDGNSRYASGALVLDVETDEVKAVLEDERCGESYATVRAGNGDIYFFPPDWSAAPHYFADKHQPTCVLRIRSGEDEFDADFSLNLSELGSGSAAAGAIPDGDEGFFFTAVDESLWDGAESTEEAVWKFYHADFESGDSHAVESLPLWSTHCYYVNVGGDLYIPREEETDDGPKTTFFAVRGADDPTEVFSFDASWYGAVKLR